MYKIIDLRTNQEISQEDLGLQMFKDGAKHIVYCDIEGIADVDGDYALLDECGNYAWIDPLKYKVDKI
jgi:hypothetical protein